MLPNDRAPRDWGGSPSRSAQGQPQTSQPAGRSSEKKELEQTTRAPFSTLGAMSRKRESSLEVQKLGAAMTPAL